MNKIFDIDSKLLAEIHANCFVDNWSAASFQKMLLNNIFFGYLYEKKGFIFCKKIFDEIEIITFCVLPQFRNCGIGKTLISKINDYAETHSVKKIFLEVSEDNAAAQKIYKNFGYMEISKRYGYYKSGSRNAIVMQKQIEQHLI